MKNIIRRVFNLWRFPIVLICYELMNESNKVKLCEDALSFSGGGYKPVHSIFDLLINDLAFRSIMSFRLKQNCTLKILFGFFGRR